MLTKNRLLALEICQLRQLVMSKIMFCSTANKMQCYTVFFIVVSALHDNSGFSTHHQ
jgi:hypothetical protein